MLRAVSHPLHQACHSSYSCPESRTLGGLRVPFEPLWAVWSLWFWCELFLRRIFLLFAWLGLSVSLWLIKRPFWLLLLCAARSQIQFSKLIWSWVRWDLQKDWRVGADWIWLWHPETWKVSLWLLGVRISKYRWRIRPRFCRKILNKTLLR